MNLWIIIYKDFKDYKMAYVGTSPIVLNVTPGTNQLTVDFTQTDLGDPLPTYYYSFDGVDVLGSGVFSSPSLFAPTYSAITF